MFERTAVSLESCHLQRLLSGPGRSSKRHRRLHAGFWQHGASALELPSLSPFCARAVADPDPADSPTRPLQPGLVASAFLLDLLYCNGTPARLRRLYPAMPRPHDAGGSGPATQRRCFTSSLVVAEPQSRDPISPPEATELDAERPSDGQDQALHSGGETHATTNSETEAESPSSTASATSDAPVDKSDTHDGTRPGPAASRATLQKLLLRPADERYHDVWDLYTRLDDGQRQTLRTSVVVYLSKSPSPVEMNRVTSLLCQVPVESWDNEFQSAITVVLTRSGDVESAVDKFRTGLTEKGLSGGLEHLLADSIAKREWRALLRVWLEYFAVLGHVSPGDSLTGAQFYHLRMIPNLQKLYFSFERWLEDDVSGFVGAISLHSTSRLGLETIRRKLAEAALKPPCPPQQAAVILEIWNDRELYQRYLTGIIHRWVAGWETKGNLTILPDIYKLYRALPNVKPPLAILHGMFDLYYPTNAAGLDELYHDWHAAWGDLDQRGYERFLKYHAAAGNVQAVKDLWARYVARFPELLMESRAFRSTMNVYAQTGDVAQAEQEIEKMTQQYGIKPDIDIWNTLLKCYTKAGDYPRVLRCFHKIRLNYVPDSYTYAHIMAMAAKKGDLETVLDTFNKSQEDKVPVSKEMAMALVAAYCRNDRLIDAEKICRDFAQRKATSTDIWNLLLHFNAIQGKLNKCYELLQAMKLFDIEWDHHTHEVLLDALVKVDQLQPAFHLLQSAYQERLFAVGPEHFETVLAGAVRTKDYILVSHIATHMHRAGLPMTFNAQVAILEAAFHRFPSAVRTRRLAKELVGLLRLLLPTREGAPVSNPPRDRMRLKKQTQSIGRATMLLVELREFATAEELVNVYADIFPEHREEGAFPPAVASALMLGYLRDHRIREARQLWDKTWTSVLARSQRPEGGIYPAHEYDLARPMGIVAKAFREVEDGRGLLECAERVIAAGFKLSRASCNLVVRYLAEMDQWERAMDWCEKMLMPGWRGWTPKSRTLEERRAMKNTRVLEPQKATVFSLQKPWLKMRRLAAWSGLVSAQLTAAEQKHPLLHYAFITIDTEHLPAAWVLPKRPSLSKAIMDMLRPLSYTELRVMKKVLVRQLRLEQGWIATGGDNMVSPFHVVVNGSKEEVQTKAFNREELESLDVVLREKLKETIDEPQDGVEDVKESASAADDPDVDDWDDDDDADFDVGETEEQGSRRDVDK